MQHDTAVVTLTSDRQARGYPTKKRQIPAENI